MGKVREMIIGIGYKLSVFVDETDYQHFRLWEYRWCRYVGKTNITYARTTKDDKKIFLHRLIVGLLDSPRSVCVDHIDHNGLNNVRSNLRITDQRGNNRNKRKSLTKTSSCFKGVTWVKIESNPWWARIQMPERINKSLGYYPTEVEAAQAYNEAATELFGEFACLNVIP